MDSNASRERYLVENFLAIDKLVTDFKDHNAGRMPAAVVLTQKGKLIALRNVKDVLAAKLPQALKDEIKVRQYGNDDCFVLVENGGGIMRTTYLQAQLRYELDGGWRIEKSPLKQPPGGIPSPDMDNVYIDPLGRAARIVNESRYWFGDLFFLERTWSDGVQTRNIIVTNTDGFIQRILIEQPPGTHISTQELPGGRLTKEEMDLKKASIPSDPTAGSGGLLISATRAKGANGRW